MARRQCSSNGFPSDWKLLNVRRTKEHPDLCLVIGGVC